MRNISFMLQRTLTYRASWFCFEVSNIKMDKTVFVSLG